MKKVLFVLMAVLLGVGLVACGDEPKAEEKTKNLKLKDVEKIKIGIAKDALLEKLGKPLKIWDDEYVSEELEDSISRNEMLSEYIDDSEKKIESGKKAQKMKGLKMYQYTYLNEEKDKETFLAWVGSDSVKYVDMRSYIDKDGYDGSDDEYSDDSTESYDDSTDASEDNSATFNVGEAATFESGLVITVTSIKNADNEKDEYDEVSGKLVKVSFTVDNQTDDSFEFNSNMIELYDSNREKSELLSKEYYSEEIAKGMKSSGVAYFDSVSGAPYTAIIGAANWEQH